MGTLLIRPPGHRRDVALRPAATAMAWLGLGHAHEAIAVPGVALGDEDVLVAIEMSTICDIDLHAVSGEGAVSTPVVLGHESVGRVIAIGDAGARTVDGTPLRIGDRVIWSITVSCASCDRCLHGMPQECRSLGRYGRDRIGMHGELTGAFSTHMQLRPGTAIVRVPEALPAAVLAPAACATATAWAAVARARRDRELEGAAVRIYGAGLVGLSATAIATEQGAVVEVQDADPRRRALAERFGAETLEREPDVVIETTGHAVAEALGSSAVGGIVVLTATPSASGPLTLEPESITRRLVTIAGVHDSTGQELVDAVAFLAGRGRAYPFAEAVGAVRQIGEVDAALAEAAAPGAPLRIGLVPGR